VYRKLALGAAAVVVGVVVVAAWTGTTSSPPQRFALRDLASVLRPTPSFPMGTRYDAPQLGVIGAQEFAQDPELAQQTRVRSGYTALFDSGNLITASAAAFLFDDPKTADGALEPLRLVARADEGDFRPIEPLPFGGWGLVAEFEPARAVIYGWSRGNAVFVAALTGVVETEDAAAYAREIDARASVRGR
jgi:hypothetical protein